MRWRGWGFTDIPFPFGSGVLARHRKSAILYLAFFLRKLLLQLRACLFRDVRFSDLAWVFVILLVSLVMLFSRTKRKGGEENIVVSS